MTRAGRDPARTVLAGAGVLGLVVAFGASIPLLVGTSGPGERTRDRPSVEAPEAALPEAGVAPGSQADPAAPVPAAAWLVDTAVRTGVPGRALEAYATAALRLANDAPDCGLGWNSLAGIGEVESLHGGIGGGGLGGDGVVAPPVIGIPLDGQGVARIADTDAGRLDGDRTWDRAVGPMQFIPSTWERWGADGDGDGVADPQDVDDAALAAARYLCADGRTLTTSSGWTDAVLSYNDSLEYAARVAGIANRLAGDPG